jgi:hypothetical protein
MATTPEPTTVLDEIRALQITEDLCAEEALGMLRVLLTVRNTVDHLAAVVTGVLDTLGVPATQGRTLRELLITVGCAPAVAARLARTAVALPTLPTLAAHAADGAIPGEHVDAICRGIAHIEARVPDPLDATTRYGYVTDLVGQFFSGATPAQISDRARRLANQAAGRRGGLPAAEDRTINTVDHTRTPDGRLRVHADLDAEVGAKFSAAIEDLSAPRPEPDGSADTRSAARRRADALEAVLDIAARGENTAASAPRTQLLITVPAEAPDLSTMEYVGSISRPTLDRLSCDATVTTVIVDDQQVPLDMGRDKRLFPPHLRTALYLRDQGCIKCGAPAGRTHAHHIIHWARGGTTTLNNGCLLCPGCHADVHHHGWDITLGIDKHPWLIPPATIDPHRRPIPAHNRRTMHLDTAA